MLSVSDLSKEQIKMIKEWVSEGAQIADVQRRLKSDFDLNVTYMDTRFLSLDLELEFQIEEEEPKEVVADVVDDPRVQEEADFDPANSPGASVSAALDQVARPGSMVSGTVMFSDGVKGQWLIDEMGRPSIDPDQPGYEPSEADLASFQEELKRLLDGQI